MSGPLDAYDRLTLALEHIRFGAGAIGRMVPDSNLDEYDMTLAFIEASLEAHLKTAAAAAEELLAHVNTARAMAAELITLAREKAGEGES